MSLTHEEMVETVIGWFHDAAPKDKKLFLDTAKENLFHFHDTLGRNIRNHFGLWKIEWVPELKNNVDYSPFHPDAISMSIIEDVWTKLKEQEHVV